MIDIIDLKKSYGNNTVLNGINISLESGKIYGFLGMNGSGKTTTMNILSGFMQPTNGDVIIDGISMKSNPLEAKKLIGYLPETPPLYNDMTVYEYLIFVATAKGMSKADAKKEVAEKMSSVFCDSVKDKLISNLSKGFRQRVGICSALIGNPKYILLDEPTSGLDPAQIVEIRELLLSLKKKHTVIFSSHILSEISEVCDNILILSNGNIIKYNEQYNCFNTIVELKTSDSVTSDISNKYDVQLISKNEDTVKFRVKSDYDIRDKVFNFCVENNITLIGLLLEKNSLEEVFLNTLRNETDCEENNNASDL